MMVLGWFNALSISCCITNAALPPTLSLFLSLSLYSSQTCDCAIGNGSNGSSAGGLSATVGNGGAYSTTVNPTRNNGGTTPTTPAGGNGNNGSAANAGNGAGAGTGNAGACICAGNGGNGGGANSGTLAGIVAGGNLMSTGPTTTTTVLLGAKTTVGGAGGSTLGQAATLNDDGTLSNAETLLSSNARFQAISAIAVAQDGVINVADQGE